MDLKDIKTLIKLVTETDITEFELESSEEKIRIKRGTSQEISYYTSPQSVLPGLQQPQPKSFGMPVENVPTESIPAPAATQEGITITSPIVGTMYRSPAPDAPPYVEVGQIVEKGQVLCIVEAMKLMNEIEAEYRCKILKIFKENAQPVEFGESLFLVEPR